MGTSEMSRLEFWSLASTKMIDAGTISKLAAGRLILYDTIIQRSSDADILDAITVYKRLKNLIGDNDKGCSLSEHFHKAGGHCLHKSINLFNNSLLPFSLKENFIGLIHGRKPFILQEDTQVCVLLKK